MKTLYLFQKNRLYSTIDLYQPAKILSDQNITQPKNQTKTGKGA